jgi:RNA polymerase subunit RPABC4/transcription elongation factor Spt4
VAELICRSCREPVLPGDPICPGCRANLTADDAVIDSTAPVVVVVDGPACPNCGHALPDDTGPVCPGCLTPLTGALVVRLVNPAGSWQHRILPGAALVLGRDPDSSPAAGALAASDAVSRRHAEIKVGPGAEATITDLDSTNGTFVDEVRVCGSAEIRAGTRIRLGSAVSFLVE